MESRVRLTISTLESATTTSWTWIIVARWRSTPNLLIDHLFGPLNGLWITLYDNILFSGSLWCILVHLAVSSTVSAYCRYGLTTFSHDQSNLVSRNCNGFCNIIAAAPTTTLMITASRVRPTTSMTSSASTSMSSSTTS